MPENNFNIKGLSGQQVLAAREKYGSNKLVFKNENGFLDAVKSLAKEPMVILLFVASAIYYGSS